MFSANMPDSKFELPPSEHPDSPLMKLASELRLTILRKLLVSNTALGSKTTDSPSWPPSLNRIEQPNPTNIHPQILSTCQLLHREAKDVLYHENMILISLSAPRSLLQRHIEPHSSPYMELPTLPCGSLGKFNWPAELIASDIKECLKGFRLFELRLDIALDVIDYLNFVRFMEELASSLSGSTKVTIDLTTTRVETLHESRYVDLINAFKSFRCGSFAFRSGHSSNLRLSALEKSVKEVVVGNEPVPQYWCRFKSIQDLTEITTAPDDSFHCGYVVSEAGRALDKVDEKRLMELEDFAIRMAQKRLDEVREDILSRRIW